MISRSNPTHVMSADDIEYPPVRKIVDMVLLLALKDRATELQFDPIEAGYRICYRVNGEMHDLVPSPREIGGPISQVFKVLTNLDICNLRTAQFGKLRL